VRNTSLDFLDHHIGLHDFVIPVGDGFLVIYAEPDGAPEKCQALQFDLNTFYLGEESTSELHADIKHERLEPAALTERLSAPASSFTGGAVSAVANEPDAASEPEAQPTAAELPLTVLPVWSIGKQALTGYWIAPEQPNRTVGRHGYDPSWAETGWHREDKDFLELDLRILARAIADLKACLGSGRKCVVGYSVHSTTMMNRNRRRTFLQTLAETPTEVRPLLLGRIAEVQAGTPMGAVAEWVHQLRSITPRVALEIHHTQRAVTGMDDVGLWSVSCVMPSGQLSAADVANLGRNIVVWSRDLKKQNLKLRLDNVEDARLLGLMLDAQVDFCSSPRLWPAVAAAEGMKAFSRDQFMHSFPATAAERQTA
jgi:hypothetical protein